MAHNLLSSKDPVSGALRPTYEKLITLKGALEQLHTDRHAWFIAGEVHEVEVQVLMMQKELNTLESQRVDGKFVTQGVHDIPEGQAVLHFLLHKVNRFCCCCRSCCC
jgi:hypothetical protein